MSYVCTALNSKVIEFFIIFWRLIRWTLQKLNIICYFHFLGWFWWRPERKKIRRQISGKWRRIASSYRRCWECNNDDGERGRNRARVAVKKSRQRDRFATNQRVGSHRIGVRQLRWKRRNFWIFGHGWFHSLLWIRH